MSGRGYRGRRGGGVQNNGGTGRGQHRLGVKQSSTTGFTKRGRGRDTEEVEGEPSRPLYKIRVTGFSQSTKDDDLKRYFMNNVKIPFEFTQFIMAAGSAIITVDSKQVANALQNLSGTTMNGYKLHIRQLDSAPVRGKDRAVLPEFVPQRKQFTMIAEYIEKNYNTTNKQLDLGDMNTRIPNLKGNFSDTQFVRLIFSAIAQKAKDVITINLANNGIRSLGGFRVLHKQGFIIRNLCFDNNNIERFTELDNLRNLPLRELVLTNNPVSKLEEEKYMREITGRFPDLELIDMKKTPKYVIPPSQPCYFDQPDRQQLAQTFLKKYFGLFDTARAQLSAAYTEQSCFSISIPPITIQGGGPPQQKLTAYLNFSRNIMRVKELDKRTELLSAGAEIIPAMAKLPLTKHEIDNFIVDCFVLSLGTTELLNLSVHGAFKEEEKTRRSFDRTFLLAPAAPNSKAALEGWPAVIINDILIIRSPTKGFAVQKATTSSSSSSSKPPSLLAQQTAQIQQILQSPTQQATTSAQPPTTPPATTLSLEVRQQMVTKLAADTGMNLRFADQCLVQNNWVYDLAVTNFRDLQARGVIPPEAFVPLQM